jgi:hypothetical protein
MRRAISLGSTILAAFYEHMLQQSQGPPINEVLSISSHA